MKEIWEPTKTGGFRRSSRGSSEKEQQRNALKVGGSSPSPVTIAWRQQLGLPFCPYLIRSMIETRWGSIRFHRWLGSDDRRATHDHKWWFLTFVWRGSYQDHDENGNVETLKAPAIRFREHSHKHYVVPGSKGASSIMITGPDKWFWGFYPNGKFMRHTKYFHEHGHHPCQ